MFLTIYFVQLNNIEVRANNRKLGILYSSSLLFSDY